MAKRIADKELTDRNWDQEEEGEEAGTFCLASEEVLKGRAIKKAKRRNTGAESEAPGAFKGFKGFSAAAATPPAFSFKGFGGPANGAAPSPAATAPSPAATAPAALSFNGPASSDPASNGSAPGNRKEYIRQLTALNVSVRDWISKHVNDSPLCDLNPIFRDYQVHLARIERQYGEQEPPPADEDDDAEEPPKPEIQRVKEDDAFYSMRCKLFYKKEAEFKEKGVGTLHLKPTNEGRTQMVIRADTNLGNILLNIVLPAAMPCSRVGRNNVMVVCVPNPPLDQNHDPVPLLIRVRTAEDADELQKILEDKRG